MNWYWRDESTETERAPIWEHQRFQLESKGEHIVKAAQFLGKIHESEPKRPALETPTNRDPDNPSSARTSPK